MEANGLIRREPVGYDARLKKIVTLPYAEEIRKQLEAQVDRTERHLTEGFTKEELAQFYEFIRRFKENLGKLEQADAAARQ